MQRIAVLRILGRHPHSDAGFVASAVRGTAGAISFQAVYGVLAALSDVGLLRKIEPAGSPALYELRTGDNHHHAVCRACGTVTDVDCAARERPCLTPSDSRGFAIDEAEVIYWGLCSSCTGAGRS